MSAFADPIENTTLNTVLSGHSSFQESLDIFVSEFENRFTHFGGRRRDFLDDEYVKVRGHDGNTLAIDFSDDNWEWY